jgi:Na+/H+-dicarboxylate symporter
VATTITAINLGLVIVWFIEVSGACTRMAHALDTFQPGARTVQSNATGKMRKVADRELIDSILDLTRNMIPKNILKAGFKTTITTVTKTR